MKISAYLPSDTPVYMLCDDNFEIAYYARDRKKYKRVRHILTQQWEDTIEQEIDNDTFWMVVACIGRKPRHA